MREGREVKEEVSGEEEGWGRVEDVVSWLRSRRKRRGNGWNSSGSRRRKKRRRFGKRWEV